MGAPDIDETTVELLRGTGSAKHVTVLLGAGASVQSGLPDWDTLAERLLLGSGSVEEKSVAELLVRRQDPMLAAEAAREAAGTAWRTLLSRSLYEGAGALDFSPLQLAAVGHLLRVGPDRARLVTLNFDVLLEEAITSEGAGPVSSWCGEARVDDESWVVSHLHGVVTETTAREVVVTLSDFTDLMSRLEPWQLGHLRECAEKGALILAGTSYRDPDLRQWLRAALASAPEGHAALVLLARQGLEMDREQFRAAERALRDQWHAIGMRAIPVHDHADAAQLLRELPHIDEPGYLPPAARARKVWDGVASGFDELQRSFSDQLAKDSAELARALGERAVKLTLWLADGRRGLVRWAVQDRLYRDPNALRIVEIGFDSPWIAGKALGEEALRFRDAEGQDSTARRWRSVLALPVLISLDPWPAFAGAVLSAGLPGTVESYESRQEFWGPCLQELAVAWGERLADVARR